jgi:hypothetical protein
LVLYCDFELALSPKYGSCSAAAFGVLLQLVLVLLAHQLVRTFLQTPDTSAQPA